MIVHIAEFSNVACLLLVALTFIRCGAQTCDHTILETLATSWDHRCAWFAG